MKTKKSEYDIQAEEFAKLHGLTMETIYLGHYKRKDFYCVSNWQVILKRPGKAPAQFTFSQSINDSYNHEEKACVDRLIKRWLPGLPPKTDLSKFSDNWHTIKSRSSRGQRNPIVNGRAVKEVQNAPSLYDVLAGITKNDPGTFRDFCAEYSYDTDSMKAHKTYLAVQGEYDEVSRLFSDCMDELQEIN